MTFGTGELDDYGYWEFPCGECARAFEEQFPDEGPCWPHSESQLQEMFDKMSIEAEK